MARSARRPRLRGVLIRPDAIRLARLEAGLSLAELGAGHVSRSAIHQIETGRVQPSRPTLALIARRTRKPIDYFVTPAIPSPRPAGLETAIAGLAHAVMTGQLRSAIAAADDLLARRIDPRTEAEARFWLGQARTRASQSPAGLGEVRRALHLFEHLGDDAMVVECLDWEAASLYTAEDPAALSVAEEALRRCSLLDSRPSQTYIRILTRLASIHVSHREWGPAIARYQEALRASESLKDLRSMASLADDLSIACLETGALGQGAAYARRALTLRRSLDDQEGMARTENNLGLALLRQGSLGPAERHLQSSLARAENLALPHGRAHVLLSLAELYVARNAPGAARRLADDAVELARSLNEPITQSVAHELLGRLAARRGDRTGVQLEFELAIGLLSAVGARQRLVECQYRYAEMLEQLGDPDAARTQFKLAILALRPDLAGGHDHGPPSGHRLEEVPAAAG
ncbi:MAG: tetratricopeptide repeat protein [Candidatus Dormibacteraceae bacterium]